MEIIQLDSQTVRIKKGDFTFHLHYYYSWDNIVRNPESVVLDGNKVNVFFPTSIQKDTITEMDNGFSIRRFWHIIPAGEISLSFTIDILDQTNVPYLFPCLLNGDKATRETITIMGERLAYPSSVFLFPENKSIMISTSYPRNDDTQGSISVGMTSVDSSGKLRIEICYPPKEKLPNELLKTDGFIEAPQSRNYVSSGDLKKEVEFFVIIEPEKPIFPVAVAHAHKQWGLDREKRIPFSRGEAIDIIKKGIEKTISLLVVNNKGIAGPKTNEKSDLISISTTAGFSSLLQRFFSTDLSMHEASLEYADFVLKAQHPQGIFFEYYVLSQGIWETAVAKDKKSARNQKTAPRSGDVSPVISLMHSAYTAEYLLTLSTILKNKGYQSDKYAMAAKKCIDLFFDQKGHLIDLGSEIKIDTMTPEKQSFECLEFIRPLIKMCSQSDKDIYKKAIKKVKDDFLSDSFTRFTLPAIREGEKPDFRTALILLKTAVVLTDTGFPVKDIDLYIEMVLPWIYFNNSSAQSPFVEYIGILDSFSRCRLIFAGYELAYYLLRAALITGDKTLQKLLNNLAKDMIIVTKNIPAGTPWYQHTLWTADANAKTQKGQTGMFSAASFVREAWHLLNIIEEFPDMLQ